MSPSLILLTVTIYSILLFVVVWYTSRKANNESYFIGNRSSKWYLVAYGMIGASLSGVTFMSVPGAVFTTQWSYLQVVIGYLLGYVVIAYVLMPVYYKMQLTSIYTYLEHRFGNVSYKTGSMFFIISRVVGAAFRMFIVVNVLQTFVLDVWGFPFWATVLVFILLILLYTYEGGVKTIIYTDTLQTTFMICALVYSLYFIVSQLHIDFSALMLQMAGQGYSKIIVTDILSPNFVLKNVLGGMAIAVAMTGLDQEMMQKNLSCKNIGEAQKNMISFAAVLLIVNILFLVLGGALCIYAGEKGIAIDATKTDDLFPMVALKFLGTVPAIMFLIGLISAAYPSADGALTALTTAFCYDFLGIHKNSNYTEHQRKRIRYTVHIAMALLLLIVIVIFKQINNDAVIRNVFTAASLTYGPLLGLYAFGFLTKYSVRDAWVWLPCVVAPLMCWFLKKYSPEWFGGYKFGFELLIVNGLLTFAGLLILSLGAKKPITQG